jgi:predicted permease
MMRWHGGWSRVLEALRFDAFVQDVRYAARVMRRSPVFTLIVVSTLALAIGATVTAFSITDAWLFRSLPFPEADRLVVGFAATPAKPSEPAVWVPYRAYLAFKDSARGFSSIAGAAFHQATWRTPSSARMLLGMRVTPEFFATFGVPPLRGRTLPASADDVLPAMVISYGFWQRELGGAETALGSTVTLSDVVYTVVGIMPPDFDVRLLEQLEGAAFWIPLGTGERGYEPGGIGPVAIIGRLNEGVPIDAARAEVVTLMRQTEAAYPDNVNNLYIASLNSLQADNARTVRATLLTVLAAALCVLLIASINVGTLLLGRGLARRGEAAVRQALGAARARVVRQFLAETVLLSVGGGAFGIGLAALATRLFLAWNPLNELPVNAVRLDLRSIAIATLAMAVTALVAGLLPAIRMSDAPPATAFVGLDGRATAPNQRAQHGMLVAQMAVSTVLLVSAGLLTKTFFQVRTEPLGYQPAELTVAVLSLPFPAFRSGAARHGFYTDLEERLLARPAVRAVAAVTAPLLTMGPPSTVYAIGADDVSAPRMGTQDITVGFFDALGIPVIAGRRFDRRDGSEAMPVVILNARAAIDLFGDPGRAIGKQLRLNREAWREVVGVVGNVRTRFYNALAWRTPPLVYRPAAQGFEGVAPMAANFTMSLHIRADRPLPADEVREAAAAANDRAAVLEVQRVPTMVAAATKPASLRVTLLLWFCGVSLLLVAIGVHGVVTQSIIERRREIAIRVALGADLRSVTARLVRGALIAGSVGLAIGVALATMLTQLLASLLYGVSTNDAASIGAAAALLLAVIGAAAWEPALRAARVDPMNVLRG